MNRCTQLDEILQNMFLDNRKNPIEFQEHRSKVNVYVRGVRSGGS